MRIPIIYRLRNVKLKQLLVSMSVIFMILILLLNLTFYNIAKNSLEEQAKNSFSYVRNLLELNINIYNDKTIQIAQSICNNKDLQNYLINSHDNNSEESFKIHKNTEKLMLNIISLNNHIETIKIYSHKDFTISATSYEPVAAFSLRYKYDIPQKPIDEPFFTDSFVSLENKNVYYAYVYPIHSINTDNFGDNIGTAFILINLDKIFQKTSVGNYTSSTSYLVLNRNGEEVSSLNVSDRLKKRFYKLLEDKSLKDPGINKVKENGVTFFYSVTTLSVLEWVIILIIPASELNNSLNIVMVAVLIASAISLIIVLFIANLLIRNIYHPIRSMVLDMSKVNINDENVGIRIPSENEIGNLAKSINDMLRELADSTRKTIAAQNQLHAVKIAKTKSDIIALQSQISPHFLYNTLECIQSIAFENNIREIATITSSMAMIYRYAVADDNIVTLKSELLCVKNYLKIMSIRYQSQTVLDINIPESLMSKKIFRMSLQPIMENAFTHGLEKSQGDGFIKISAYQQNDHLIIKVMDSGKALSPKKAREINDLLRDDCLNLHEYDVNKGIALININRRLYLSGGSECGLFVSLSEDGYAVFTLVFPNFDKSEVMECSE